MTVTEAYHVMLRVSVFTLSITIFACLFRAILGPRFTDRVVSVNIIGPQVIAMIAVLSFLLDESRLVDIAVVYAMISFLAIVVLSKCYLLTKHASQLDPRRKHTPQGHSGKGEGAAQ